MAKKTLLILAFLFCYRSFSMECRRIFYHPMVSEANGGSQRFTPYDIWLKRMGEEYRLFIPKEDGEVIFDGPKFIFKEKFFDGEIRFYAPGSAANMFRLVQAADSVSQLGQPSLSSSLLASVARKVELNETPHLVSWVQPTGFLPNPTLYISLKDWLMAEGKDLSHIKGCVTNP